jgi:hypothetical protein
MAVENTPPQRALSPAERALQRRLGTALPAPEPVAAPEPAVPVARTAPAGRPTARGPIATETSDAGIAQQISRFMRMMAQGLIDFAARRGSYLNIVV